MNVWNPFSMMKNIPVNGVARGLGVAAAMFVALGTVMALWQNPLFMRMTPTGGFEITLLLDYYEPIRLYLALGGVALLAVAVWMKVTRRGCFEAGTPSGTASP